MAKNSCREKFSGSSATTLMNTPMTRVTNILTDTHTRIMGTSMVAV